MIKIEWTLSTIPHPITVDQCLSALAGFVPALFTVFLV